MRRFTENAKTVVLGFVRWRQRLASPSKRNPPTRKSPRLLIVLVFSISTTRSLNSKGQVERTKKHSHKKTLQCQWNHQMKTASLTPPTVSADNVATSIPTTKVSLTPPTVNHSSIKLIQIPDFGEAWGMLQPTQELVFKTFGYGILNSRMLQLRLQDFWIW